MEYYFIHWLRLYKWKIICLVIIVLCQYSLHKSTRLKLVLHCETNPLWQNFHIKKTKQSKEINSILPCFLTLIPTKKNILMMLYMHNHMPVGCYMKLQDKEWMIQNLIVSWKDYHQCDWCWHIDNDVLSEQSLHMKSPKNIQIKIVNILIVSLNKVYSTSTQWKAFVGVLYKCEKYTTTLVCNYNQCIKNLEEVFH